MRDFRDSLIVDIFAGLTLFGMMFALILLGIRALEIEDNNARVSAAKHIEKLQAKGLLIAD